MKDSLPHSITWRTEKVGFEAPQKKWMGSKEMEEGIREARKTLADELVLDKSVLSRPVVPSNSYDGDNLDWRYFSAATLFK
jgi:asparagine synthase (glutamine-hydrolysing)